MATRSTRFGIANYEKLAVWAKAHELVLAAYRSSSLLPKTERYGLTSQIRRAAISIPANLAEGSGRRTDGDLARFVSISLGSANELEFLIRVVEDLGYLPRSRSAPLRDSAIEVRRMLHALRDRLREDARGSWLVARGSRLVTLLKQTLSYP